MKRQLRQLAGLLAAALLVVWRLTCRRRVVDDPRPRLRAAGQTYVMALLHAQQLAAVLINDEAQLAAMVSRSADGDALAPALRRRGILPVRGSSRSARRDKGGLQALQQLEHHVAAGHPAVIAVDGPRGPRGHVGRGILALARRTGAVILPVQVTASRRSVLRRTWDGFEVPWPGSELVMRFGTALRPPASAAQDGALRQTIGQWLTDSRG